jgi:O-antigen/teichoic acid export membrane protein
VAALNPKSTTVKRCIGLEQADSSLAMADAQLIVPSVTPRRSVGESVFRGALANLGPQPLTWAASLLSATLVPRFLGSDGFGQLTIAFAISGLAAATLDLGIVDYLTRRIARNPDRIKHDLGVALCVQFVTFFMGALLIAILAPILAPSLVDFRILDIALLGIVGGCAQSILTSALRGREDHVRFAWANASPWVIGTVGTVLILLAGANVLMYAAAGVALALGAGAFNWWVSGVRPSRPAFDLTLVREAREFVRGGFPFVSWNLTMAFYNGIDRVLLGFFVPASEIGWYAAAYRIIGIPIFIPSLVTAPLFPILSRSAHEPDTLRKAIAQTLRITLLLTMPIAAGICVVAPVVPAFLGWPADFASAVPLMMILSLQMPIVAVDMLLGTVIMAIGREGRWVRIGLVAAALNVGCNLIVIPFFEHTAGNGAIGASLVTVATEIWLFVGAMILIPKHLLDPGLVWQAARILVAAIGAALVATTLMPVALMVAAVAGAITYGLLVTVLRVIAADDLSYVNNRLFRRSNSAQAG